MKIAQINNFSNKKVHNGAITRLTIGYFGDTGGSKDSIEENTDRVLSKKEKEACRHNCGLDEIIAETMYIKSATNWTTVAHLAIRSHLLMMNFPRTIACAAKLLDESVRNKTGISF